LRTYTRLEMPDDSVIYDSVTHGTRPMSPPCECGAKSEWRTTSRLRRFFLSLARLRRQRAPHVTAFMDRFAVLVRDGIGRKAEGFATEVTADTRKFFVVHDPPPDWRKERSYLSCYISHD
jgi:hypothetical protein